MAHHASETRTRDDVPAPTITAAWLRMHVACRDQVAIFEAAWPDGAEISEANLHRAVYLGLDLGWVAWRVLSASAWQAYEEATAPARRACEEVKAAAWQAYEEARAAALWHAGSEHGWEVQS